MRSVVSFAAKRRLLRQDRRGQLLQAVPQRVRPVRHLILGQTSGKGEVIPKLLHEIRLAPSHQRGFLPVAQPNVEAADKRRLSGMGVSGIKTADADFGYVLKRATVPSWRRRKTAARGGHRRAVTGGRHQRRGGLVQVIDRGSLAHAKEWRPRPVKPIFPRCRPDIMQTGHVGLTQLLCTNGAAAGPDCPKLGREAFRRHVANGIESV